MRLSINILSIGLVLGWFTANAQKEKITEYKAKGTQFIIRRAVLDMQDSFEETRDNFDLTAYDVSVWTNNQELKVIFKLPPIVFLPANSSFYGNLAGKVISHRFSMEILANPSDFEGYVRFYPQYLEAETLYQIDFVIDAMAQEFKSKKLDKERFEDKRNLKTNKDE